MVFVFCSANVKTAGDIDGVALGVKFYGIAAARMK